MTKLLLLALLYTPFVIPLLASRSRDPRRGLRRVVVGVATLEALIAVALILTHRPGPPPF